MNKKQIITALITAVVITAMFIIIFISSHDTTMKNPLDINNDGEITITDYTENRIQGYEIIAKILDIAREEAMEVVKCQE